MNTYLKYQPPAVQFFAFLTLAGGFFVFNYLISNLLFADINAVILDKNAIISPEMISKFKWAQLASATVSFVVPALLFGYFSSPKALPYVGVQKTISPVILIAAIGFLFFVQPFINWLGQVNAGINFGSMQKSLLEVEEVYNRVFRIFLQMKTFGDLIINLLIMALLPAIGEELFFRGSLQKALLRLTSKPWLAILMSSLVFALLHGTFFKLIPIFTLGLALGVIYHVTRNLWYTITIHFLNNAFAVLAVYYADKSDFLKKLANDDVSVPIYAVILSLVLSVAIILFVKRKSDEVLPEIITNEDNDYIA